MRRSAPEQGTSPHAAPLLVLCALGAERWALRGGDWTGGSAVVAATGMGPDRARRAVTALLRGGSGYGALLATGFCAAVGPGIQPGDAVVAAEVRGDEEAPAQLPSPGLLADALLADALRARGLTVHTGTVRSVGRVVRGPADRRLLYEDGAIAVDMETAAVLGAARRTAPGLRLAAVRIVVDTPRHELLRPGTIPRGVRAWRALRSAVPAFTAWHRTAPPNPTPVRTLPQEAS